MKKKDERKKKKTRINMIIKIIQIRNINNDKERRRNESKK